MHVVCYATLEQPRSRKFFIIASDKLNILHVILHVFIPAYYPY